MWSPSWRWWSGCRRKPSGGSVRDVPSPAQRRALARRDRHCRFPGCERPVRWTDAHHIVHWTRGGPTDLDNLVLLCRRHHRMCHEGGWELRRDADGSISDALGGRAVRHRGISPLDPNPTVRVSLVA
jgi:hypothetical protein